MNPEKQKLKNCLKRKVRMIKTTDAIHGPNLFKIFSIIYYEKSAYSMPIKPNLYELTDY